MSENQAPDEENQIEQLALRLLIYPGDPRTNRPRLFLGKIPENFPLAVPIPEKSLVLGTLARSEEHVEIVLESDQAPGEVIAFYRERLKALNWNELEDDMRHHMGGGFLHSGMGPHNHVTFCQGSDGASLALDILQFEGRTDMRLHITLGREGNPCVQQKRPRRMRHGFHDLIPPLIPPAGAQQRGGGGGGGDTEWHTNATLKTELALDVLAKHYAEQLSNSGWTLSGEGTSDFLAWRTWKFTDEAQEPWSGLFFILKKPDKAGEYLLNIIVEWNNPAGDSKFSGWMNSASSYGFSSMILENPRRQEEK